MISYVQSSHMQWSRKSFSCACSLPCMASWAILFGLNTGLHHFNQLPLCSVFACNYERERCHGHLFGNSTRSCLYLATVSSPSNGISAIFLCFWDFLKIILYHFIVHMGYQCVCMFIHAYSGTATLVFEIEYNSIRRHFSKALISQRLV